MYNIDLSRRPLPCYQGFFNNTLFFIVIFAVLLPLIGRCQPHLPAFTRFASPVPAPLPPGDPFTLPTNTSLVSQPANLNTPACAEFTRTAGPDESILITGNNFSAFQDQALGQDTRFAIADGSTNPLAQPRIQRLENDKAILTLPKDLPYWGMLLLWPANQNGYGSPIALNQTEAWWLGPNQAAPGSTFSVYGRNLSYRNDTLRSYVYLKPRLASQGPAQWVHVSRVNPYRVSVVLPTGLVPGEYEVWTHNGHGGAYGWSGPLQLSVQPSPAWSSVRFDVKAYGAVGDGQRDDTQAIQKALTAARQSPGSTLYFPAGTYLLSDMLLLASNTRWLGAGKDRSVLRCSPSFSNKAFCLLYAQQGVTNLELTDLAIEANHNYRGNFQGNQTTPIDLRGSQDIRLTNVRFSFQEYDILQLDRTNRVFITGCELIGKISFLGKSTQVFIDRCRFRLTNDAELALHSWGGTGISLTNSTCEDFDNRDPTNGAGWGKGRFFVGTGNWGSNRFTYLANNTTKDLTPRPQGGVDQNSGEQFLWEGNQADWVGSPSGSTAQTTTLRGFTGSYEYAHDAVIIKGRGLGQSRRITAYNNGTITLETPWRVAPDQSSVVAVGNFVDRVVLYQNSLDGKLQAVTSPTHVASAGIEPFGGTTNLIADGNTLHELRSGIANWATQYPEGMSPNYFNLFTNNKMLNCRWGIQNVADLQRPVGTAMLGTVYRRNTVSDALVAGITTMLYPLPSPSLDAMIYEHNELVNVARGYSTEMLFNGLYDFSAQGGSLTNQVLYANRFSRGSSSGGGPAIMITPKTALRENTFTGYSSVYQYSTSKPVLELPVRVVELRGQVGGVVAEASLTLWNSGTSPLNWDATSSADWLVLVADSHTLPDERSSNSLQLRANPQGLAIGEHTAIISVMTGIQIKYYTVKFTVFDDFIPTLNVYPNPFQGKTTVKFQSPWDKEVVLQIFNLQGSLLETLFKGVVRARQIYSCEFSENRYASSAYICRLICGEVTLTKKVVLTK